MAAVGGEKKAQTADAPVNKEKDSEADVGTISTLTP